MKPIKGKKDAPNFRISFKGEYYEFKYVNYKVHCVVHCKYSGFHVQSNGDTLVAVDDNNDGGNKKHQAVTLGL